MRIIVIAERHLLMADAKPSPDVLRTIVGGLPQALSVRGPGHVRGYCDDMGPMKGDAPNVLATLFYRKHGYIGERGTIVGAVALTGGDGTGGYADCPHWVLEELNALVPQATAINDLATARPN